VSRLAILAAAVFDISCEKTHA